MNTNLKLIAVARLSNENAQSSKELSSLEHQQLQSSEADLAAAKIKELQSEDRLQKEDERGSKPQPLYEYGLQIDTKK